MFPPELTTPPPRAKDSLTETPTLIRRPLLSCWSGMSKRFPDTYCCSLWLTPCPRGRREVPKLGHRALQKRGPETLSWNRPACLLPEDWPPRGHLELPKEGINQRPYPDTTPRKHNCQHGTITLQVQQWHKYLGENQQLFTWT